MSITEEKDLNRPIIEYAGAVETVILMDSSVDEALQTLRGKMINQKIIYFYVVDATRRLKGVVSARQMLLARPEVKVAEIMQDWVVKLKINETLNDAFQLFDQHPLLALPVVDHDGKLLGAVDVQIATKEALDIADMHNRESVFQMIGLTLEDKKKFRLFNHFARRMPWLLCNVIAGLICAIISRFYEHVLAECLVLAFFLPLVLTLSDSVSMQSMAHSLQLLRRPRFSWNIIWMKSCQEWLTAGLLALACGAIVGSISLFWGGGGGSAFIIGFGIILSVVLSSFFAAILPVILFRMKLDPKIASGPVVLMITDMLTIALYLTLATYLLVS